VFFYGMASLSRFPFLADALHGSGGFAPPWVGADSTVAVSPTYLVQYPRESAQKFNRRNHVAVYRNFLHSASARFCGYLFAKSVARMDVSTLLLPVLDDADRQGNQIDVFWQEFALNAKARGTMLLLVDMPAEVPFDRQAQQGARALPYFAAINPEDVADYALDDTGRFDWVALSLRVDGKLLWKVWDKTGWWIQEPGQTGRVLERGEHPLNECPVLIFTEWGGFPCYGEFSQIADLSKAWFNRVSERDEILRAQTFSVLTYQVVPEDNQLSAASLSEAIGTHSMLTHRGIAPAFIAPDSSPAQIYAQVIADLETAMRDIGYSVELTAQAEAAAALNLRFKNLSSALTQFARRLGDLEARAWDLAVKWLGNAVAPPRVEWPTSYDLADVRGELDILQGMQASNFPGPALAEQQKRIVSLQFQGADSEVLDDIFTRIDETAQEIPASDSSTPP
jgi:hypothetical protein